MKIPVREILGNLFRKFFTEIHNFVDAVAFSFVEKDTPTDPICIQSSRKR